MPMPNDDALLAEAVTIRDETQAEHNTQVRVGTLFVDLVSSKISSYLTVNANENISAYSVVTADGYIANSATVNQRNRIVGINPTAISNGFAGDVVAGGKITNAAWSWTPGDKIFLNGTSLSTTAPSTGFVQMLGIANKSDTIEIQIKQAVLL